MFQPKMINQQKPQRFHIPISFVKHETTVNSAPKRDPLHFFYFTGLFIGQRSPTDSNLFYWFRVIRSVFLTLSCIILFVATLYHTAVYSKFTMKFASYHLACYWFFQSCLNVALLQYWQHNEKWSCDMHSVLHSPFTERLFRQNRYLMFPIVVIIVAFLACLLVASNYRDEYTEIFKFDRIFESTIMVIVSRLISWYTVIIFLTVNHYFITTTGVVRKELNVFNKRFAKELSTNRLCNNNNNGETPPDLFTVVHSFYLEHLHISNKIRALDRSLSVFAFTTATTTIPTTVFCLWTFIVRLQSSWLHLSVTLLELLLCGIALLFLVINPSMIREEVLKTRGLIFSSVSVWDQYEPKVYDIARLFVAHLDSSELGLSIWGFIIITKQFVLSVVSITLTFLVFLLETQNGSKTLVAHRAMPKLRLS